MKLNMKLAIAGFASALFFPMSAMSAPISALPKDLVKLLAADENQIVQVRAYRGGGAYRGGAVRRGAAYRGGAVVRRGVVVSGRGYYGVRRRAVVGSGYYGGRYYSGGSCDPYYQDCGGGTYYRSGVYRSGVYRSGYRSGVYRSGVYRSGAYRGRAVIRRGGAHVSHYRGGGGRRR